MFAFIIHITIFQRGVFSIPCVASASAYPGSRQTCGQERRYHSVLEFCSEVFKILYTQTNQTTDRPTKQYVTEAAHLQVIKIDFVM